MLYVFYVVTCYYPTIPQAGLQILDIQEFFSKFYGNSNFRIMISKMESKFHKYEFPIPVIYG